MSGRRVSLSLRRMLVAAALFLVPLTSGARDALAASGLSTAALSRSEKRELNSRAASLANPVESRADALVRAHQPNSSPTTIVVRPGTLGVWDISNYDYTVNSPDGDKIGDAPTARGTFGSFVEGPGSPPGPTGSAFQSVGIRTDPPSGDDATRLRTSAYNGMPLADITTLSYWTYVDEYGSGGQAPYIQLRIDLAEVNGLDGATDDALFFEPVYQDPSYGTLYGQPAVPLQGPLALDVWQQWDTMAGGWWSNIESAGGPPNTRLSEYLLQHPGARLATDVPAIRIQAGFGGGAWAGFRGNVDMFTLNKDTYDFEAPIFRVHNIDTGLGYDTPQAAIADPLTLNGHTIVVNPGVYPGGITLNKDLTLRGAQAGNTACGRVTGSPDSTTESIITGPAPGPTLLTMDTGSAGSTIDGFSFIGGTLGIESNTGPINGVSILNNHLASFTSAAVFLDDPGTDVTVSRNNMDGSSKILGSGGTMHLDTDAFLGFHLTDNCILNGSFGAGVFVDGAENVRPSAGRRPLISGNRIENHATNVGLNLGSRAFREGTISGNRIANNAFDGLQGGVRMSRITGNLFDNNGRWGLALTSFGNLTAPRGAFSDTITGNTFTANDSAGLFISAAMFAGHAGSNLANYNDIVGNGAGGAGYGAIYRGTETFQVGCNWWGDINGPDYAPGNPNLPGDALFASSAVYFPWLDGSITGTPSCNQYPPVPTTTALNSDLNPSNCGQKVNLTATVSPATATGTVDFRDGGVSIGTAPVIAGMATLSISSLGGGHHPLIAAYGGDADHLPSVSSQLVQNVHCATTSTVVEPTPCDSMGWSRANMRLGGSVDMTATYPQSGLGSLEFGTTGPISKADWVRPNGNADLLSTLSTLMVDLYRNSSSTSPAHFAPAVRLLVYNGQALNSTSYLIWEPIYNGVPVYPTNVWTANDLFKANFWQRAFRTTGGKTIDDYNRTLSDWLQPGFIVYGDGDTSVVVGPNARVIGYEIGVGSGWAGTFAGAADNFKIGFGATDSTYNFEPRLVTSTSLAADMAKSFCGGKLTLTANVSPAGAEGVVQFADQAGVAAYFEGFETGLGGDPGWDHGVSTFTAVRVPSGTNGVTSANGGFHAEAVTANGSAFSRWGGYSAVFPAAGYTTMVKVYLDVAYAMGAGDQRVDFSSAISNNAGGHRRDFVFNMGTEATGWVISAGNNSGRANSFPSDPGHDPVHITASGWYTLKHRFYDDGGVLACQMSLISPSGTEIIGGPAWKRKDASDVMSVIGGNRYGWFANQELPFFAFDDAFMTNGTLGSAPVVGGVATLSVTTLQPGSHTFIATFVPSSCATASSSGKVAHEVNQGSSTLALVASPNPAKSGADLVELEATVSPSVGTGTVEFFDGATSLGISPVVGGVATLSLKFAGEGDHSLTATYSGDACLLGSSAPKILLAVGSAPSVSIVDLSTTESNTGLKQFKFLVTLSSAVTQPVTVDFQTSDGSATLANNDYVATNGTVIIPAGALTDTARVNVRGDTNREGDETFTVTLLNPTKATIADGSATGTIINDDGVPSILHTGVRVAEGHPGLTNIVLTVSLSNPTDVPVTVNWATADSNATLANNDYIPASGQVTILPKQLSTTLVVQAVGDSTNEDWEVFHVLLSNPVNATLGARPWLRVELSNDDTAPVVYIGDVTQLEGDAGTTAFTFRVWLSRGTVFGTPTVTYTTQNGTATTGNNDYNFATGNVVFGPKEREKFVTVFVNGDVNFEADETFTVKLSNPRFGMGPIGDGTGVGTILNDDPKGCPEVTALTPDPNLVVVGGIAKLGWVANGTDNPVTSIDLFISRNLGTSWEILSLGEANDGTYTWNPVSGPGTNALINPAFTALLKVVAYDAPGCSTVAVSGPFAIYNTVTDVLVAQFQANPAGGGVEVRWELASGLAVESVELERSSSLDGPWEVIAADRRQDGSTVVALDRTVSNGTTYYYRLALRLQGGGGQVRVGPIEISAGSSITSFALGKISPNPSRGMTRISYDLPRETSVRLSVVDVAGREVAVLASGSKGAGSYQAVWSGETDRGRAPAGLYFVRFQAAGVNFVRRLVLTR